MNYVSEAVRDWVWNVGRNCPDSAWLLSNYDTWHANPFYIGPKEPHPESYEYSDDYSVLGQQH